MKKMPISKARSGLTEIVNKVAYAKERVILTRKGKKIAAIVSMEDLAILEKTKSQPQMEDEAKPLIRELKKTGCSVN